ncbi:rhomboid family intramembrane serine protease [Pseudomarimonas arenosa]|uniref:Rhomboid family intramembrane serine protease n=1 Tax=Pseudomarimonas arenosa TaxID=2774145 RepID=A0AAW3ZUH0_9GAMM|nr:rhomboid family intramembrane serine protease [Pseudomarimonas arenosa]MBD8527736.1 rhomboid family intramembrane serine protease [Pseudomarimonas arenosa]
MLDHLPPVTRALLISNVAVFVLQMLQPGLFNDFMLWPWGDYLVRDQQGQVVNVGFLPWQVFSYGFMHGGLSHLFLNMFALYMFGGPIEQAWGTRRFSIYYFTCLIGAGLIQLLVATSAVQADGGLYPTVGASGAVFGLLLAFGMQWPNRQILLLIPPIPMKARTFVIVYGLIELVMGVTGTQSGVAHFAHLGGMAFGFGLIQYWRGRWPFERRRR